jgi:hypothetical protein
MILLLPYLKIELHLAEVMANNIVIVDKVGVLIYISEALVFLVRKTSPSCLIADLVFTPT